MAGERSYVRVPPDSSGKKIRHEPFYRVTFNNRQDNHIFHIEHPYTIEGSVNINVTIFKGVNADQGALGILFNTVDTYNNVLPIAGDLIKHDGITVATVVGVEIIETPYVNISGGNNPHNTASIDNSGSMNVRFDEGRPQLDAFGKLKVSRTEPIGDYSFTVNTLNTLFSSTKVGTNADVSFNSTQGVGVVLSLDPGATEYTTFDVPHTGLVTHTSNTFHHYIPGLSQLYMSTIVVPNPTVGNALFNWGYNDILDGVLFRVDGDGTPGVNNINVVLRNSTSGVSVETVIPQNQWNGDQLLGLGESGMTLDVTKDNIYWIDFEWLGAGTVRYGVYHEGKRIVCHTIHNNNKLTTPYMRTGSLPVCQSIFSKTGGTLSTTAELHTYCIGVFTEGQSSKDLYGGNNVTSLEQLYTGVQMDGDYVYVGSLSPKLEHTTGVTNRSQYFPEELEVFAIDENGLPVAGEIEVYLNPILKDTSWENIYHPTALTDSYAEKDLSATYLAGGEHMLIQYLSTAGHGTFSLYDNYKSQPHGAMKNFSCKGGSLSQSIANITQASPAVVTLSDPITGFREWSEDLYIENVVGMTEINNTVVYVKPTGLNTLELYHDKEFTNPVDSSGYSSYVSNGAITGFFGTRFVLSLLWKPFTSLNTAQTVRLKINWKEVIQ